MNAKLEKILRKLDTKELEEVIAWSENRIEKLSKPPEMEQTENVADIRSIGQVTYRHEFVRCGKERCKKCADGNYGHGAYWYAYFRKNGRLTSKYIGRDFKEMEL